MSHLLAIAVGPVQEFIAAARRTRDLWFGSYLLSEISRAVAKSVEADGGQLIFPASFDAENVANVILAELPSGEPEHVATKAKQAAEDCWKRYADEAWGTASEVIRQDIWDDQVNDVIEFYAAWVASSGNYKEDRGKLMRLLAGRKNCRDFIPAKGRVGVPKSSLDGQRESVLKPPTEWAQRFRARLRIREGEQLDVVGLVKRVAEGNRPYPSVSRIAADPWIRGNQQRLDPVRIACEQLGTQVIRRLNLEEERGHPHFAAFPYEGTAVYTSRHHELIEETEATVDELRGLRESLARLTQPEPYLAVLIADGDRMGAAIANLNDRDKNRAISKALASFAVEARKIVNDHNGVLVYAGGDDVLAFLPVDKCLGCARELREKFVECLKKEVPADTPTLSVGIAIGHFMENLEDLLDYGRAAEKAAKKVEGKDALAVHLHKRGGAPIKIAKRWETDPETRLLELAEVMNDGTIPTKLPYELRTMSKLYESWDENVAEAIKQDLARVIAKKSSKGVDTVKTAMKRFTTDMDSKKLLALAEEMLVARQIATVLKQAGGES